MVVGNIRHKRKATMTYLLKKPYFYIHILFTRLTKHSKRFKQSKGIISLVDYLTEETVSGELFVD